LRSRREGDTLLVVVSVDVDADSDSYLMTKRETYYCARMGRRRKYCLWKSYNLMMKASVGCYDDYGGC